MSDYAPVRDALDALVPWHDEPTDWEDVLERARGGRAQAAPPRRRALVIALLAATGLLGATAPGRALVGDAVAWFSAWQGDSPGTPASEGDRAAFTAANAAAYAKFPSGTRVGLLSERAVAGRTVRLLGLRERGSLCLWLVRADLPEKRPPYCVPLSELARKRMPAAIAVAEYGIWVNEEAGERVSATFGVAADGVAAVELVDDDGRTRSAPVENNAFLFLRHHARGQWVAENWVVRAVAVSEDGSRIELPFFRTISRGRLPVMPSRLVPGPAAVEREPETTAIGWLERRELRGEPSELNERDFPLPGRVEFSRAVRPDPKSAVRVGISLVRVTDERYPGPTGALVRCVNVLSGLASGPQSGHCRHPGTRERALEPAFGATGQQFAVVAGLASDGVAAVRLFLATGESLGVPLADNAYAITVSAVDFPPRLVAYDVEGRVIATVELPGPMVPFRSHPRG